MTDANRKDDWASFSEHRNGKEDCVPIRVRPARLGMVSCTHSMVNDAPAWRRIVIALP